MRKALVFLCLTASTLQAMTFEEVKKELETCCTLLAENPKDPQAHYRLAIGYFYDQELNLAFKHFLLALEAVKPQKQHSLEKCKEALESYLSGAGSDSIRAATELLSQYKNETSQEMKFLLSIAYANLGEYETFFRDFFEGYPYFCETFLAYKIRGILALRLAQHETDTKEASLYTEMGFAHLTRALELYPTDPSLYNVLIFLAKDEKNDALVANYLRKIVEHSVKIARADIYLYVREAVALGEVEMAQKIIDQARKHYEFSRAISAAQDYLNQHRGGT